MIRKSIYSLLFGKPLFDYAVSENGIKHIKVLIVGDNSDALESFKAVYWCGQMSDSYRLSINVASKSPDEKRREYYDIMPALSASLVPVALSFVSSENLDILSELGCNYIILSDDKTVSQSVISGILDTSIGSSCKKLICAINGGLSSEIKDNTEIIDLSNESIFADEFSKLERYAYNCDFAYAMGLDERCNKKTFDEFKNDEYGYLSSLSFSVHIPYKLKACEEAALSNGYSAIDALSESIENRNALYYCLLDIEHRRWMAYTVTDGWRMPSDEELADYAYQDFGFDGNDHRNKERKLHPCMCTGSSDGCQLLEHNELWEKTSREGIVTLQNMKKYLNEHYPDTVFSDLEAISLVLHSITNQKAYPVNEGIDSMFGFTEVLPQKTNLTIYNHLRQSAHKLKRREENAISLFDNTLKQAEAAAEEDNCSDHIDFIKRSMQIVIERNRKKNYFMIDSAMIDMIPFCLWYGEKNKTVVTFSSALPTDDVIVPTLLCAEKAIFVAANFSERYVKSVVDYFKKRNHKTEAIFKECDTENQKAIFDIMNSICDEYDGVAINCVDQNDAAAVMTVGAVAENKKLPVFVYLHAKGLINLSNGKRENSIVGEKSFTVDEYVSLMGGDYSNLYAGTPYFRELDKLEALFVKHSYEQVLSQDGKIYSTWSALSNFFQSASKNRTFIITGNYGRKNYQGKFEKDIFENCRIDSFLLKLQDYHIIVDYKKFDGKKQNKGLIIVEFVYFDSKLKKLLSKYDHQRTENISEKQKTIEKRLVFSLSPEAISYQDLHVENAQLCNSDEQLIVKGLKAEFIKELLDNRMISSVSFSKDKNYVSLTFESFSILNLFKNQGKLFELLLYYKLKNSGFFSDVQTGVKISWNSDILTLEELMHDYIDHSGKYGYNNFVKAFKAARSRLFSVQNNIGIANEIDIVMTNGMTPIFISCKTSKSVGNGELYEIASIAEHFHAKAVLAVTKDLEKESNNLLFLRAKQMGVSLIGFETIFNQNRFERAIKKLSLGQTVFGKEES